MNKEGKIVFFVLIVLASLFYFSNIEPATIGFVVLNTKAGQVTEVVIRPEYINEYWQGIVGNLSLNYSQDYTLLNQTTGIKSVKVNLSKCIKTELYISNSSSINFSSLLAATPADVNLILNLTPVDILSATKVFTFLRNFSVNGISIETAAAKTNSRQGEYYMGILKDGNNLVFVTDINDDSLAFDNSLQDFQFMLPVPKSSLNLKYNFFLDPDDVTECRYPVINSINNITLGEGNLVVINATGYDPNGLSIVFNFSSPFNQSGQWQTTYHDSGVYPIIINLTNSQGFFVTKTIYITINDIPTCGDNVCQSSESCSSCMQDCGSCPVTYSSGGMSSAIGLLISESNDLTEIIKTNQDGTTIEDGLTPEEENIVDMLNLAEIAADNINEIKNLIDDIKEIKKSDMNIVDINREILRITREIGRIKSRTPIGIVIDEKEEYILKEEVIIIDENIVNQDIELLILGNNDFTPTEKIEYDTLMREIAKHFAVENKINRIIVEYANGRKETAMYIEREVSNTNNIDYKPAKVYVIIDKSAASSTDEIEILTEGYTIVKKDPIFAWEHDVFKANETKVYSWIIRKDLNIEIMKRTKTIVVVNEKEAQIQKPDVVLDEEIIQGPNWLIYLLLLIICLLILCIYSIKRESKFLWVEKLLWEYDKKYSFDILDVISRRNFIMNITNKENKTSYKNIINLNDKYILDKSIDEIVRKTEISKKIIVYSFKRIVKRIEKYEKENK